MHISSAADNHSDQNCRNEVTQHVTGVKGSRRSRMRGHHDVADNTGELRYDERLGRNLPACQDDYDRGATTTATMR